MARMGKVWTFKTARFEVALILQREHDYRYDGDDENGETQKALDDGELVAFNSSILVRLDGETIGSNHLGGSVYRANEWQSFFTGHRDPDAMNRNCTAMRAARGSNMGICHYFPDMVKEAIAEARDHVRQMRDKPSLRK